MPIFRDYSENGNLIGERAEPLSSKNFERYVQEGGKLRTLGYLEALADIVSEVQQILRPEQLSCPQTPHLVKTNLKKFLVHKESILNALSILVETQPVGEPSKNTY
ncbi:hypothetical protein SAMN04487890_11059 [Mucilaginibacter polytrichastri]|nr:hypothetical protein SAMN04487890_11059 [Mucilaginibacter polytrichastri]